MEIRILNKLVVLSCKYINHVYPKGSICGVSHFKMTVEVYDHAGDKKCRRVKFDFYQSPNDMSQDNLINALTCYMTEATYGDMSYETYKQTCGCGGGLLAYNDYRGCLKAARELKRLFPEVNSCVEFVDIIDEIDKYNYNNK